MTVTPLRLSVVSASFPFDVLIVPRSHFIHFINISAKLLECGRQSWTCRSIYLPFALEIGDGEKIHFIPVMQFIPASSPLGGHGT